MSEGNNISFSPIKFNEDQVCHLADLNRSAAGGIVGNIMELIEVLGLSDKQEESFKNRVKKEVWGKFSFLQEDILKSYEGQMVNSGMYIHDPNSRGAVEE